MTKVDLRYELQSPLNAQQLARLAELRGVYGVLDLRLDDAAKMLQVEYDASRLNPNEVTATLRRAGIPALRV